MVTTIAQTLAALLSTPDIENAFAALINTRLKRRARLLAAAHSLAHPIPNKGPQAP